MNKTQLIQSLIADSDITKKQAQHLLETLASVASTSLKSEGSFTIPGIVKLSLKDKPATAERQGINPFTKASVTIPAKPASKKVKALPVAALKNSVA
jgi:nucleoid DNA-binding protein